MNMIMIATNERLDKLDINLVENINNAKTRAEHERFYNQRRGLHLAAEALGFSTGQMHINADMHYIVRGIDRPMCGGEFLDWEPKGDER